MWKLPDESLIGKCEHNITQGFLSLSLLWYQKFVFVKFPIIKFAFSAFLYHNSSSLDVDLNRYWVPTLVKVTGKIKLVHEIDLVCDHLWNTKKKLVTNLESCKLSLYAFKAVCISIFETLWGKLRNLLGMKSTTSVTLLILSAVHKDIYIFSSHRCWLWN